MRIYSKIKYLALIFTLTAFGQAFASNFWADHTSMPGTETIDEKTFYSITTPEELAWFALQTEVGKKTADTLMTINAILKNDIDLAGKIWTPICPGAGNVYFNGVFDGGGHSIKNMTIVSDSIYSRYFGLYGYEGNNIDDSKKNYGKRYEQNAALIGTLGSGTVKNVAIEDISFYVTNSSNDDRQISVGAVVGWKSGKGGVIDFCSASGTIITSGAKQGVGGLVGNAHSSTIKNSISYVNIYANGEEAYVGGIVGLTKNGEVKIESCVYAGENLVSTGEGAAVGAVAGYVVKGTGPKPSNTFYDIDIPAVGNKTVTGATKEENLNSESVVCVLNGGKWENNACTEKEGMSNYWSEGLSDLSLNGSDGYKITFDANGGSFAFGAKTTKILAAGETITADEIASPTWTCENASPTCENKMFAGWATSNTAEEPSSDLDVADASKKIFAVWYGFYDVTFHWNSQTHTNKVAKHDVVSVEGFTVPKAYESDSGKYYFTGWAYEAKWFKNEEYIIKSTDTVRLASIDVTQDINLYAVWTKARTLSVTFNATMHGTNDVKIVRIVSEGDKASEPDTIITDPGYRLVGWFTDAACTAGNEYNFDLPLKDDLVLYAKWEVVDYTISYEMNGGTNAAGNPATYNINSNDIVLATPTKEGASFDGWFYSYNEQSGEYSNRATQISKGSSGNKTLYAKWTPYKYTIRYLSGSRVTGTTLSDVKEYGVSIHLKGAVDKFAIPGCSQDGWSIIDGGDKVYDVGEEYTANENLTLYPHWVENREVIHQSGAVTVYQYATDGRKEAVVDGEYTGEGTIDFPTDVTVNSVEFTRSFTPNTMSTLMLPFSIDTSKVSGGKIYRFKRVDVNDETGVWKVIIGRIYTDDVGANTPYLVLPTAEKMTFEGPVTFNTTEQPLENAYGLEEGSTWEFKGTFAHTNFDDVQEDGPMYAFAGRNKDGVKVGQFKKIGTGVKAYPMQAYLVDHGGVTLAKSATRGFNRNLALPDVIDIEIEDENGIVVETGKLNTVTGAVRMDCWFDLKGRRLNSKPSVKGTYYKNGKKVIIK